MIISHPHSLNESLNLIIRPDTVELCISKSLVANSFMEVQQEPSLSEIYFHTIPVTICGFHQLLRHLALYITKTDGMGQVPPGQLKVATGESVSFDLISDLSP